MKKTALMLMILTIISKTFGFFRDICLSYFYGASSVTDAYLVSITIPSFIFAFMATGISTGYIPMFSKIEKEYGVSEANRYTNNLINILWMICSVIIVFGFLFTKQIVNLFASGFEGETLILAIRFTRISLFSMYFTGSLAIFNGFLQLKDNYIIPAIVVLPMNLLLILSIFLSTFTNILMLSIGTVIAIGSQLIIAYPFVCKKGYVYNFIIDIKDKHIKNMISIALPLIIGVSVNQINTLVDRTLASKIIVGGISSLNYASKINGFVLGIFVTSISTVLYPTVSKMIAENNIEGFKKSIKEAISGVNLLVVPATIGAMIFSKPVVHLLFGRGAFDVNAISLTSYALFFYSMGMVGFGLREVLARAFYSMQDTKTPMINATIGMAINIILNMILAQYIGIGGLALATSISAIFTTGLMFITLRKKIGPFGMKRISISFVKILFASLIMGGFAKLSFDYLTANIFSQNLSLIIAIGIGALIYFTIIYFMKIDDVDVIVNAVKKKLRRSKAHA